MNIDEMPAGREMDALIAEKVMGWRYKEGPKFDYDGPCDCNMILVPPTITDDEYMRWSFPPKGVISKTFFLGKMYSTDIAEAWEVIEKIDDCLHLKEHGDHGEWEAYFCSANYDVESGLQKGHGNTASLAICRAALKVVGVNEI